jgi:hypothetical protein
VGVLHYDGSRFVFDDRVLAHLQIVMTVKLRRSESFFLNWTEGPERGSGRHAIWIDAAVPIHIEYSGNRLPAINREWVETLTLSANSSHGLFLTKEGEPPTS